MGYYIYLNDHDFTLLASQFDAVLERWRQYEEGNLPYPSASVFYQYPNDPPVEHTVPQILKDMGFEIAYEEGEGLTIEGWEGKSHSEGEYIRAIADLIEEGWFLDWTGEDDERWRMTAGETITGETVFASPGLELLLEEAKAALATTDPKAWRDALAKFVAELA